MPISIAPKFIVKSFLPISCFLVATTALTPVSQAANIAWGDGVTGNYTDNANWIGGAAPGNLDNVYINNGTLNFSDAVSVSNSSGYIGRDAGSAGTLNVSGLGSVLNYSPLEVGYNGNGTLNILNGATVNNTYTEIGYSSGSVGLVTIDGASSIMTNSYEIIAGYGGNGTLNLTNGGRASSTEGYIGYNAGVVGEATIDGSGSRWTCSDGLYVGYSGDGTLDITNGGELETLRGYIGFEANGVGEVVVDGTGSVWNMTAPASTALYLGSNSNSEGTLSITNGGAVYNASSVIGDERYGTGEVNVDGTGSVWTNSGSMTLGYKGDGTLNVINGGTASNTYSKIGSNTWGVGEVNLSGANSVWNNSSYVLLGEYGEATINLSEAATLKVDDDGDSNNGYNGTITVGKEAGSKGTINIGGKENEAAKAAGSILADKIEFGLGSSKLILNHTATDYDLTQDLTGNGIIKLLAGTTELSGDVSAFTGSVTVNGGTLVVNNDWSSIGLNLLSGGIKGTGTTSGLTSLPNNFVIAPGNSIGTLNINGDFVLNSSSTLEVEFDANDADKIVVSGDATIDGSLKLLPASGQTYTSGDYTILTANAITGSFADQTIINEERLSGLKVSTTINATEILLSLDPDAFQPMTSSGNSLSNNTASYIDSIRDGSTGDLDYIFDQLALLPTADLDKAMESVSGKRMEAIIKTGEVYTKAITNVVSTRQILVSGNALMGGSQPVSGSVSGAGGLDFVNNSSISFSEKNIYDLSETINGDVSLVEKNDDKIGIWLKAFGRTGSEDNDVGATGYEYGIAGFVGGADYKISEKLTAGLVFASGKANINLDGNSGSSDITTWNLGSYGTYSFDNGIFTDGLLMLGYNDIDSQRRVVFGGVDRLATGSADSYTLRMDLGVGKKFDFEKVSLLPQAKIGYMWSRQSSYDEVGAGGANLHYDKQISQTMLAELGVEASKKMKTDAGLLTPYLGIAGILDNPLDDRKMSSGFIGSGTYFVAGNTDTNIAVSPSAGLSLKTDNNISYSADYEGEFDHSGKSHSFSFGLRYDF
ncbi:MAG: autotransporter domain-containing protein [Alphaproteobacteria bacterium]